MGWKWTGVMLITLAARSAGAADLQLSVFGTVRSTLGGGHRETLLLYDEERSSFDSSTYLAARPREIYPGFFAQAAFDADWTGWLATRLAMSSGLVRPTTLSLDGTTTQSRVWTVGGRLALDELAATGLVREALIDVHDPATAWWHLRLGRKLWRVGSSLVYDDFGLGAELMFDLDARGGTPVRFTLQYLVPSRDWAGAPWRSPFVTARVDWVLSLFESLSLSLSYFHDGDGELTENVRQAYLEGLLNIVIPPRLSPELRRVAEVARQVGLFCLSNAPFVANGDLVYAALSGNKLWSVGSLQGTVVLEAGKVWVTGAPAVANACAPSARVTTAQTLGVSFDLSYRHSFGERLALTAFIVGQSGDRPPREGDGSTYWSFLGVAPFVTRTNLFFAGGLFETFGSRRGTAAGVNGRGVLGGGLELVWDPVDPLRLKATAAPLFSWASGIAAPIGGGGRFYGMELDLLADYQPWSFMALVAEGDVIFGTTFYRQADPIWRVIVGVDWMGAWEL